MDILEDYIGPEDDEDEDTDSQDDEEESESDSDKEKAGDKDEDDKDSSDDSSEDDDSDKDDDSDEDDSDEDEESDQPLDVGKVTDESLYADERVKRLVQSERDKATDLERKKARNDARKAREEAQRKREAEEDDALLESEDYEGFGKRELARRKAEKEETESAKRYDLELFDNLQVQYADLGEDRIAEIINDLESKGKLSIPNLIDAFGKTRSKMMITEALKEAGVTKKEEDEADETEARAKKRSGKKKVSPDVSGNRKSKPVKKATTDDEMIDQYNDGDLAFDELPPEVQKRVE